MAFHLPSLKSRPECPDSFKVVEGEYGVPEVMKYGLTAGRVSAQYQNPASLSDANYLKNQEKIAMTVLRNTQGLHAPLKLAMEQKFAKKVGRLPFLPSSNIMSESISGRDIEMNFEDILNIPEFWERTGHPHAIVEKSLGIL